VNVADDMLFLFIFEDTC